MVVSNGGKGWGSWRVYRKSEKKSENSEKSFCSWAQNGGLRIVGIWYKKENTAGSSFDPEGKHVC